MEAHYKENKYWSFLVILFLKPFQFSKQGFRTNFYDKNKRKNTMFPKNYSRGYPPCLNISNKFVAG